jgi:hypothetical protein
MRRLAPRSGWRLCEYCGSPLHERAWRHQSKRCPGYSDLWAMDTFVCFGENLKTHGSEAVLFSVTAPGADQLPWDETTCRVEGEHRHSGALGCQVEAGQALLWNESAQHRFSTAQREGACRPDADKARKGDAQCPRIAAAIGRRLDSALRDSPRLDESSGHRRGSRACAWRRPACLVGGAPSSRGSLCPTASASLWTYSTARATSSCPGDRLERSHHLLDERPSPDVQPCPVLHGELAPGVLWPGV